MKDRGSWKREGGGEKLGEFRESKKRIEKRFRGFKMSLGKSRETRENRENKRKRSAREREMIGDAEKRENSLGSKV